MGWSSGGGSSSGSSESSYSFSNATLDAGLRFLLGYYDFESEGDDEAFSNKAPYGTFGPISNRGMTVVVTGPDGFGIQSADSGDYAVAAASGCPTLSGAEFSICAIVNIPDATPAAANNLFGVSSIGAAGLSVQINTNGAIRFFADGSVGNFRINGSANDFSDATDHLVILTRQMVSGTPTWYLYLDNAEIGNSTVSADISLEGRSFLANRNDTTGANGFIGVLSAFQFWGRALSSDERSALYNSGSFRFLEAA